MRRQANKQLAHQHQVVPMHHLGFRHIAEQFFNLAGRLFAQQAAFGAGVIGQAARQLHALQIANRNHIAARKLALDAMHTDGQQTFAFAREFVDGTLVYQH